MTTTQHLELIKAFCTKNLEIAAKRTPGNFSTKPGNALIYKGKYVIASAECHEHVAEDCPLIPWEEQQANAAFTALCAGAAEAGWKATITAIEHMEARNFRYMDELAEEILAAYPLTLIQP